MIASKWIQLNDPKGILDGFRLLFDFSHIMGPSERLELLSISDFFFRAELFRRMTDAELKLKQGLREKAVKDLETWNEQRNVEIEKQKAKNRLAESNEPEERPAQASDPSSKYDIILYKHMLSN